MTAYFEEPDGKVRADFALRIGRLFLDYERRVLSLPADEQLDATLTVTLLQSLLTTCNELLKKMPKKHEFDQPFVDVPNLWGLRASMVTRNTFPGVLTQYQVLERMRNALSHPTYGNVNDTYPVSGFRNINGDDGKIQGFSFVNSPDITTEGKPDSHQPGKRSEQIFHRLQNELTKSGDSRKLNWNIKVNGKYEIHCDGAPYARVFQMDVPLPALKELLKGLSNYLAQPSQANWNRVTISQLIA